MTTFSDRVIAAIDRSFKKEFFNLSGAISRVITTPRNWGEPYGRRDIVDKGTLRGSQRADVDGRTGRITWGVKYALYQHEGYTLRNGRRMPGRPFARVGLNEFDLPTRVAERFRKEYRG
jgi:hypothetical protein